MKGKLTFTPTSLWQKWEVAEQMVNAWDDSMSSKYYDENHEAPILYKPIYVYGNGSVYDYMYSEDPTLDTKFYDGLTYLDHYDPYTENLGVQPNLLTGAMGYSNDANNRTMSSQSEWMAGIDNSVYDDFNKHIRDYDGKRLVVSCDIDITFKDVTIPSSIPSINVYGEQVSSNEGSNWDLVSNVKGSNVVRPTVSLGKIKSGSTYMVHLYQVFTICPQILKLNIIQNALTAYPSSGDGLKIVFDSHAYNAKLEVIHDNINPKSNALTQKYTGPSNIAAGTGSLS